MIEIDFNKLNMSVEQFNFSISLTANLIGFSLLLFIILVFSK